MQKEPDTQTQSQIILLSTLVITGLALICTGSQCVYGWLFGFDKANEFGDFVSGVSNPIIAFGGAYLVYITISTQIEANKTQRESLENEIAYRNNKDFSDEIITDLQDIVRDLDLISTVTISSGYPPIIKNLIGKLAIKELSRVVKNRKDFCLTECQDELLKLQLIFMRLVNIHQNNLHKGAHINQGKVMDQIHIPAYRLPS